MDPITLLLPTTKKIHFMLDSFELLASMPQTHTTLLWQTISLSLFTCGLLGVLFSRHNLLVTVMNVEIMYLGAVASFVFYGLCCHDYSAAIYALLVLIFAACESAVGLGLLIVLYRKGGTIGFKSLGSVGG